MTAHNPMTPQEGEEYDPDVTPPHGVAAIRKQYKKETGKDFQPARVPHKNMEWWEFLLIFMFVVMCVVGAILLGLNYIH